MRSRCFITVLFLVLACAGCSQRPETGKDRNAPGDAAAREAGKVAHTVAKDAGKLAVKAGRGLARAAEDAHEGWKQAAHEDRAKDQK